MHTQLLIADFPNSGGSFPSNGQLITIKLELIQSPLLGSDKWCCMITGLYFDHKWFPTVLNSVSSGPLSRKSIAFLFPLLEGTVTRLHWVLGSIKSPCVDILGTTMLGLIPLLFLESWITESLRWQRCCSMTSTVPCIQLDYIAPSLRTEGSRLYPEVAQHPLLW